jgi:hypothetical protein
MIHERETVDTRLYRTLYYAYVVLVLLYDVYSRYRVLSVSL